MVHSWVTEQVSEAHYCYRSSSSSSSVNFVELSCAVVKGNTRDRHLAAYRSFLNLHPVCP